MEDKLLFKTPFDERQPSLENGICCKTNIDGRQFIDGRQRSIKDSLQLKTSFNGRQPSMENEV